MLRVKLFVLSFLLSPWALGATSFTRDKLPTGLDVVMMESHKVPLVTIVLASKAGAMTETPDTNGLTHLWEHMFFKGNKTLKNQEAFNARIRELGIDYNGDTAEEKVRYYFTLPSVYLADGIRFMYDAISSPLLEQKELEKERLVVMDEWDRNASDPSFNLYRLRDKLLYGDQEYLRDALGEREIIAKATREQLLTIKDEVFTPSNSAIFVSGDFDPKDLKKLIHQYFSNWKDPKGWKPVVREEFPKFPSTTDVVMTHPEARNVQINATYEGPKAKEKPEDTIIADVLLTLLQHKSGKFYKEYIDSGLTYGAGLSYPTQAHVGAIHVFAETKPENAKKVKQMLLKEPEKWAKKGYFAASQLEDVRRSLLVGHKFEENEPSEYIKTLAFWWAVTGLDYYETYLDNLRKVSLEDVQAFAKRYFVDKPYVATTFLSPEDAAKIGMSDNSKPLLKKYFNI
ncbi:MAG: M16 family metallopeptidase [Oligoflexales bacterium]